VRPVPKKGVEPVFADTRSNFQVGVTLPFDTITNLISMETVSGFGVVPPPDPELEPLEAKIWVTSAGV
jgi:hypothetical protein